MVNSNYRYSIRAQSHLSYMVMFIQVPKLIEKFYNAIAYADPWLSLSLFCSQKIAALEINMEMFACLLIRRAIISIYRLHFSSPLLLIIPCCSSLVF